MFLEDIVTATQLRVKRQKENKSLKQIAQEAMKQTIQAGDLFQKALKQEDIAFLCEVKKASPSKGILVEEFPYTKIAIEYEEAGAAAISVLTEPEFFQGKNEYLEEIEKVVSLPILRKDFVIDVYQIYEAKRLGASAILLISEILTQKQLKDYLQIANRLGLSVLVESHSLNALYKALEAGAMIIGINNRNLDTFAVDLETTIALRKYVPKDCTLVSESGIQTKEEIQKLRECGVDAVLMGETFMKSTNKKETLKELRGEG